MMIMFLCLHNGQGATVRGGNKVIIIFRIEGVLRTRAIFLSLSRIIILNRMQTYVTFCGITPSGPRSRTVFRDRVL